MAPPTLLTLPYDVKVQILKELLWSEQTVEINKVWNGLNHNYKGKLKGMWQQFWPAILRTCRTLYEDGVHILYNLNAFEIYFDPFSRRNYILEWVNNITYRNFLNVSNLNLSLTFPKVEYKRNRSREGRLLVWLNNAKYVHKLIELLSLFASPQSSLRHLTIDFRGDISEYILPQNVDTILIEITLLRCISGIKSLMSVGLEGKIPKIWLQYLNRKMGIAIQTPRVSVHRWNLKEIIVELETGMKQTEDLLPRVAGKSPTAEVEGRGFATDSWNEPVPRVFTSYDKETGEIFRLDFFDEPQYQSLVESTTISAGTIKPDFPVNMVKSGDRKPEEQFRDTCKVS